MAWSACECVRPSVRVSACREETGNTCEPADGPAATKRMSPKARPETYLRVVPVGGGGGRSRRRERKKVLCCVVDGVGVGVFSRFWVCVRVCVLCLCRRGRDLFVFM